MLQTVALFETLLARIKLMKQENQELETQKIQLEKRRMEQEELLTIRTMDQEGAAARAEQTQLELRNTCEVGSPINQLINLSVSKKEKNL